jgi:hypothetical protein
MTEYHEYYAPPLPDTLEDALREIKRLRKEVFRARQNWAKQVEEREKDRRAAKGNIKALTKQLNALKGKEKNE